MSQNIDLLTFLSVFIPGCIVVVILVMIVAWATTLGPKPRPVRLTLTTSGKSLADIPYAWLRIRRNSGKVGWIALALQEGQPNKIVLEKGDRIEAIERFNIR